MKKTLQNKRNNRTTQKTPLIGSIARRQASLFCLAGVRGVEPRSKVLETFILTTVLYPYVT